MRRFLFLILLLLGGFFIFRQSAELGTILESAQNVVWRFLYLAILVQVAWLFNVAFSYRVIYRAFGIPESPWRLLLMSTAATATNIVAPSGGVGGVAVFVSEAHRRRYSTARTTVSNLVYLLLDYTGFLVVLFAGVVLYLQQHPFNAALGIAAVILLGLTTLLGVFIFLGLQSEQRLGRLLLRVVRGANRLSNIIKKRDVFQLEKAWAIAKDTSQGLQQFRRHPRDLWLAFGLALNNRLLLIAVLWLVALAFQMPLSFEALIVGFSIGYLFFIVSPTPAGLGFVEGALALTLTSYQLPSGTASLVTLVYRGITFWLPLMVGLVSLQVLAGNTPFPSLKNRLRAILPDERRSLQASDKATQIGD